MCVTHFLLFARARGAWCVVCYCDISIGWFLFLHCAVMMVLHGIFIRCYFSCVCVYIMKHKKTPCSALWEQGVSVVLVVARRKS